MSDSDFLSLAAALYDGGWRSGDYDALVSAYDFSSDLVARLCEKLSEYEKSMEKEIPL